MSSFLLIWFSALVFVIAVWVYMASEWGFVDRVDDKAFVFRSLLRKQHTVEWNAVTPSVQEFTSFLPRIIVRLRDKKFGRLHSSFAVLLRDRDVDRAFADHVRRHFQVVPVERFGDLFK
jgi:hypothetical protein